MRNVDRFQQYAADWFSGREITVETIKSFKAVLGKKVKAASSMRRYIVAAKPWLAMQRLEGKHNIDREGVNLLLKPPTVIKKDPEAMLRGDVAALLKACYDHESLDYAWFVLLSLTTGARVGEVVAMQGSHFNAAKGTLRIFATKTASIREVPLKWSQTMTAIAGKTFKSGAIFKLGGMRGGPETGAWRKLLALAGLPPVEPRILRATAASIVASSGHLTGMEYCRWFGHSLTVAMDFYIAPNGERAEGKTIEEWYGLEAEFKALTRRCLGMK